MKKSLILITLVLVSAFAFAQTLSYDIDLNGVEYHQVGVSTEMYEGPYFYVTNTGDTDDIHVSATIDAAAAGVIR